jgi:hypothetical protein
MSFLSQSLKPKVKVLCYSLNVKNSSHLLTYSEKDTVHIYANIA